VAIPDFQAVMRPLLASYAGGEQKRIVDAEDELGGVFELTPDEERQKVCAWHNWCRFSHAPIVEPGCLISPLLGCLAAERETGVG
jgi:hypothetical protein